LDKFAVNETGDRKMKIMIVMAELLSQFIDLRTGDIGAIIAIVGWAVNRASCTSSSIRLVMPGPLA
jgi:hypothetical protein